MQYSSILQCELLSVDYSMIKSFVQYFIYNRYCMFIFNMYENFYILRITYLFINIVFT